MVAMNFQGRAKRLDDIDLPRIGAQIGVGEDAVHALLEVESRGTGFDSQGRPLALFEPHVFWRELGPGARRNRAVAAGLAYQRWGERPYPRGSYPRILAAMAIDETAALRSTSWALPQLMGHHHALAGYATVQDMVSAFADDEENQLAAMIAFIKSAKLDDDLRAMDRAKTREAMTTAAHRLARGYNGPRYAENDYHNRLVRALEKWRRIPDTKWSPDDAANETMRNDRVAAHVTAPPPPVARPSREIFPDPAPAPAPAKGFWASILAMFTRKP